MRPAYGIFTLVCLALVGMASAELVAVSQLGYHPQASKQVVSYSGAASGTFAVHNAATNAVVFSGTLAKARDFDNTMNVECQGNNPCLVGGFSSFTTPGTYYVQTSLGGKSPTFTINNNVFSTHTPTLLEFFNAQLQQDSAYHGDMHSGYAPPFTVIADGSFLMEADQAALSLIRLGSAYRRNPQLFQTDKYTILSTGKPDMQEYMLVYADYLAGLQGVAVENRTDGTGFRLSQFVKIEHAFTPGPVTSSSVTVYNSGKSSIGSFPVKSLCGADDGSAAWDSCVAYARDYYKCQLGEICLNMTYTEKTGALVSNKQGYDVSKGWSYEFGCYSDIPVTGVFNDKMNPCLLFHSTSTEEYTVLALLAYLEALPAIHAYSPSEAQEFFERAVQTQRYIKSNYFPLDNGENKGYYGAALFLLYDYTGDAQYLREAHALRDSISIFFISDRTRGNEFYWEEYSRHKNALTAAGLEYKYTGEDPENFFRGKIFNDYKDQGERSISRNAERVFVFDNNVQFSNSRFILTEGVLAAKATELFSGAESFIPAVADSQLAWMTGMNGVQDGTDSTFNPVVSYSFIFGIGKHPQQFHSRYLLDTGYRSSTGGKVVGARSTGFFFSANGGFTEFDGVASILGQHLGALGNRYNGEAYNDPFKPKTFANGNTFIPGWINGAFDVKHDNDVIFNYRDNRDTWEMTETTNEKVATALELFAYLDGRYNGRPRAAVPAFTVPDAYGTLTVQSNVAATVSINGEANGQTTATYTLSPGTYTVGVSREGFGTNQTTIALGPSETKNITLNLGSGSATNGTLSVTSTPTGAALTVNGVSTGTTPKSLSLSQGTYTVTVSMPGYASNTTTTSLAAGQAKSIALTLYSLSNSSNETCYNSIEHIPVSCTGGSVISDTFNGCRQVACSGSGGSIAVMGCDKGTKVELYKQSHTGTAPKVCFGSLCIQHDGFASANFPVCTSNAPACTPTTEVCDSKDNDCDGQIDEGDVCAPTCTPSAEVCDSVDNDCDGQVDEGGVCTGETCYNSMKTMPASCTGGTITTDSVSGGRTIVCTNGADKMQVQAWDKSGFFEMYKQSHSGTKVTKICIGETCISNSGYAKSTSFPVCLGNTTTCTPTTETCNQKDDDCDGQVDENNVCEPVCSPTTETCNSVDDDCDGQVDEGCFTDGVCYNSVKNMPVSCSVGSVTQDEWNGCRFVTCTSGTNSLQVQACDKSGFFEMYRKTAAGTAPKICFLSTCMQNEGYVKSGSFPICTTDAPTCTPKTEICNSKDDDCDGQVDEGGVCDVSTTEVNVAVAQWYPKGREYSFNCNAQGFTATAYGWNFGDGTVWPQAGQTTYYTYKASGSFTVTCTASGSGTTESGTLNITAT